MLLWANCFATLDRISFTSSSCSWEETVPASSIDLKKQLRSRMELIVARTLASILDLDIPVQQHLPHKYSTESAKQSEVLSVERMIECRIAMTSSALPVDRLEGLIPRPQNFHKRIVLLQLAKEIIQFIWQNTNEYMAAVEDDRKYTCICDEEDECSSTMRCPTRWFHKYCVDVPDGAEDDDWWCS
ncbi:hypothetical protein DPMN_056036 [Dreissena polymorpha]|uniref:Zinc finger PHD-type domain-containing protein n=1 Tax=Dreissena polymorpha TaxID=45954 RepID=A0A9D4CTK5_DREPO|nr:hypothetical protein DPMN_056036 [Dreissena polymorpha]